MYIQHVTQLYDLTVTKLPKGRSLFFVIGGTPMLLSFPFVNSFHMLPMPTNVTPFDENTHARFACVDDELLATHGTVVADDGDLMFVGQKLTDVKLQSCVTPVNKLPDDLLQRYVNMLIQHGVHYEIAAGLPACAPLKQWTDDDVWNYIAHNALPWSSAVYSKRQRRPHDYSVCYRCHDPHGDGKVFCPKLQTAITNLAHFTNPTAAALRTLTELRLLTAEEAEAIHG
jgi:hypothetical protein